MGQWNNLKPTETPDVDGDCSADNVSIKIAKTLSAPLV
jgi:hypothetical protein